MNDKELDELLNTWRTPPAPASLREGVRAGIAAKHRAPLQVPWRGWRLRLIAGAAVAAVVFLLADTSAFPEKVSPPPYTVDSQIIQYAGPSGQPSRWINSGPESVLLTSYNQAGSEVILSWSAPDYPLEAAFWAAKMAVSDAVARVTRTFLLTPDTEAEDFAIAYSTVGQSRVPGRRSTLLNSGCRAPQGKVVGQEVILNYPAIAVQYHWGRWRMTLWMAPELSCFALRATVEAEGPFPIRSDNEDGDGSWTLLSEKRALKVTVNRQ